MSPNTPTHPPIAEYQTPRVHLFESIFWEILPKQFDDIQTRWRLVASLYHEASAALMATDRAAGVNSLKVELNMLEDDLHAYRDTIYSIAIEDIVGVYVVAGKHRQRAEQLATRDFEDLEKSLKELEDKVKEIKADIRYGFEQKD
jgi:lysyl-tRNA synthetase class II